MGEDLITLERVSRQYASGRVKAVSDVSLSVRRGEWLTVVGPSGSGKSTLLHLMSGLDRPDSGRVSFQGREPKGRRAWARLRAGRIGFIFQAFNLLPTLTARENVQVPMFGRLSSSRARREKADLLLDRVGLADRAGHRPSDMSGGERQRVAIARCLANDPVLILADEPTGNLDTYSTAAVMDLLHRLSTGERTTMVMVTHDADLARRGDNRIEMVDGRICKRVDLNAEGRCAF